MTTDYKSTVFLPKTDFPMRAGLPKREPEILAWWKEIDLDRRIREVRKGAEPFILHDGPPYANGHLHMGHALNKILKDRGQPHPADGRQAHANYVPGWDCHGLPIEWKIEEEYRVQGQGQGRRSGGRVPPASAASSRTSGSTSSARSSSAWA
ncbi:MAG: class I tRNA ligase family protein [Thalassobaculum sp.]